MSIPIAVQLYSVRQECAQDLLGTIAKVGAMGYAGVEFAGYHGHSAEDIREALDKAGLEVAGTHISLDNFTDDKFDETIRFHRVLGCKNLVIPWIPKEKRDTEANALVTAQELSALTTRLAELGFRSGFHVHGDDMHPLDGGKSAWYVIGENTPTEFILQYDTANGILGGADPVQPIRDFPGRGQTTHLKEYSPDWSKVIGEGEVPWPDVFAACEGGAGTEWYIVEHESEEGYTPLEAIEKCLANLRAMGK
jgi:sugar phosphate isomerase/epimerase